MWPSAPPTQTGPDPADHRHGSPREALLGSVRALRDSGNGWTLLGAVAIQSELNGSPFRPGSQSHNLFSRRRPSIPGNIARRHREAANAVATPPDPFCDAVHRSPRLPARAAYGRWRRYFTSVAHQLRSSFTSAGLAFPYVPSDVLPGSTR